MDIADPAAVSLDQSGACLAGRCKGRSRLDRTDANLDALRLGIRLAAMEDLPALRDEDDRP